MIFISHIKACPYLVVSRVWLDDKIVIVIIFNEEVFKLIYVLGRINIIIRYWLKAVAKLILTVAFTTAVLIFKANVESTLIRVVTNRDVRDSFFVLTELIKNLEGGALRPGNTFTPVRNLPARGEAADGGLGRGRVGSPSV